MRLQHHILSTVCKTDLVRDVSGRDRAMTPPVRIRMLLPVYNDWIAACRVLRELDAELDSAGRTADVLLIDDASTEPLDSAVAGALPLNRGVASVQVLRLRRNLGHQRAIAIGLAYLEAGGEAPDLTIVMDADGEDRPSDVPRLIEAAERGTAVVFAERRRRSEGPLFATLYHGYRGLHRLFTGISVRVGNFSAIPRAQLSRLVAVSDLWNHFAAAVFKSRIPFRTIATQRGRRYAGEPHMNFSALASHGLSAMAAFGDRVGVRLLLVATGLAGAVAITLAIGLTKSTWTPGTPFLLALVLLLLFQTFAIALTFVFVILGGRDTATFLPLRDYHYFILECVPLAAFRDDQNPVHR